MFSLLRNRFGIPGVISVVALVFAMVGGAYAANSSGDGNATASAKKNKKKRKKGKQGGLNAKQKRQVRVISTAIAKRFQGTGPAGPVGPAGPQGPAGANGNDGAPGQNGTNGADGKSVETGNATLIDCPEGGATVQVEGEPASKKNVCNGLEGLQGPPGASGATGEAGACSESNPECVLPSEGMLTGAWATTYTALGFTPISFPLRLPAALTGADIVVIGVGGTPPAECENANHAGAASKANPEAAPGFLCVYVTGIEGGGSVVGVVNPATNPPNFGTATSGGVIYLESPGSAAAFGTWAVTAP